jgi:hypothetical protein
MTTERSCWVALDGIGDGQLAILREEANDWLVAKADDLRRIGDGDRDRIMGEVDDVAALGRLVSGLRRGEVLLPDRAMRELVARSTTETERLDSLKEEYDRLVAEHDAWTALLAHLDRTVQGGRGR